MSEGQFFGGGMGSHKHGISGKPATNAATKQRVARDDNRRREERRELFRRQRERTYATIRELFRGSR